MTAVFDTLKNLVTGLGTSKDKGTSLTHVFVPKTESELNAMHRSDWLARKIVDIIPNDMTREWRDWQAESDQITALEEVEKAPLINLQKKLTSAMQKARLFGGAAIYMGIKGQKPEDPLDLNRIAKGGLEYLHLLHRHEVTVGELIKDVTNPLHGEPSWYEVYGAGGSMVRVHPSRMIRFVGAEILDDRTNATPGWGDSILQIVYDAVLNAASAQEHIAALIPEAKTDVIYMPGLSKILQNATTTTQLTNRFTYANTAKSMFNMLLLEGNGGAGDNALGEKWEQKQINFAQLPELAQQFLQIAAGAADIPVTRLLGQSPSGLNSTGDGDLHNYYDNISARQRTELSPALHRLEEVIIRSALGTRPPEIYSTWAPLYTLSEKEQAEVLERKANAARALVGNGGASLPIIPIEALSDALVNSLVEDGSLPGLDAAIKEYGGLADQEGAGEDEIIAATTTDAKPRTLYVSRKLLNADELIRWAKSQGFETTMPADDMHVTVAFSRAPVDWIAVGESWSGSERDGSLTITPGGARLIERFDGGAVVLLFASSELCWRHEEIKRKGASWDWPEYQPHVTLTYEGAPEDLEAIEPYRGKLVFGPEIFEEVSEDWKSRVTEA